MYTNVKQRATLAVLQRKVTIGSAKDLYDYLSENFTQPTSSSGGNTLKKRVYFYIPTEGEGAVKRKQPGSALKEVKGIRDHSCVREECL